MSGITVLYRSDSISLLYSLYPLAHERYRGLFTFTRDVGYCLGRDPNKCLLMVRFFKGAYDDVRKNQELLARLREKYTRIGFYDDSDGADSLHVELIGWVDVYFKKQLLKDRQHFLRPMYGRQLFSDYYHREFGVTDRDESIREPLEDPSQLEKLRLAWNLGVGLYPLRPNLIRGYRLLDLLFGFRTVRRWIARPLRHGTVDGPKLDAVQARFNVDPYTPSIGFQRRLFSEMIRGGERFVSGFTSKRRFLQEMSSIGAVLSPFGWGEVCFRDFEAILHGAALAKPSMDHVETWPDVYRPGETFVALRWDAKDLTDACETLLSSPSERRRLAANAVEALGEAHRRLGERTESFIAELC